MFCHMETQRYTHCVQLCNSVIKICMNIKHSLHVIQHTHTCTYTHTLTHVHVHTHTHTKQASIYNLKHSLQIIQHTHTHTLTHTHTHTQNKLQFITYSAVIQVKQEVWGIREG